MTEGEGSSEGASEQLSEAEKQEIKELLGYGSNTGEAKHNTHTFLHNVVMAEDTTKLGVLSDEEIGLMSNPVRSWKHLGSFANDIMKKKGLSDFFLSQSEIGTSTSLSRDGTLVKLAVVQHRKIEDVTKTKKKNKGWFGSKKEDSKDKETES